MHLFLLQHGDALAESVNPQRPLSEQGRNDVERLIEFVARSGVRVQRVCESGIEGMGSPAAVGFERVRSM